MQVSSKFSVTLPHSYQWHSVLPKPAFSQNLPPKQKKIQGISVWRMLVQIL